MAVIRPCEHLRRQRRSCEEIVIGDQKETRLLRMLVQHRNGADAPQVMHFSRPASSVRKGISGAVSMEANISGLEAKQCHIDVVRTKGAEKVDTRVRTGAIHKDIVVEKHHTRALSIRIGSQLADRRSDLPVRPPTWLAAVHHHLTRSCLAPQTNLLIVGGDFFDLDDDPVSIDQDAEIRRTNALHPALSNGTAVISAFIAVAPKQYL